MTENDGSAELRVHGGSGIRSELRDLETAIRNRWTIPTEILTAVPQRMLEFVEHGSKREAVSAAKVLVSLIKHNAALEPSPSLHLHQHQVAAEDKKPDEPFNLERARQKNFERIERLGRLGGFDD